ncbi:MAG: carbohydrate ABC transporter permease [Oscillospiraceae bacterium]|jgi:multiple sugar transport system permease protein|nr:carbohydrate ABC transporter permease [Oscillospiraceae bacterium]
MTKQLKLPEKMLSSRRLLRRVLIKIAIYAALILISYQFIYPILRMIVLSMMSDRDIMNPAVTWIPSNFTFNNLRVALNTLDLQKTLVGSMWFSVLLAVSQTLVSSLTGYAFARYEFPGKRIWFVMVLMSFVIPTPVVVIPRIMMFTGIQESVEGLQLIGTWIPQTVMAILGQGIYSAVLILICYNFFRMIPRSLDEAASIDGANSFQVFLHVILRLSISTVLVVFLFSFVWNWNESYLTNTFLRGSVPLLPNRLAMFDSLFASYAQGTGTNADPEFRINEAYKMSGTLIAILPLLIMYLFVQRQFIKGIENAGITGE